jgi:hypothetical protein
MSILRKMAVFIEKPPETSSNCYGTIKNAFNTDETWHKCWLHHSLCHSMLNPKFSVPMATGERLKIAKNHYFALFFSKCCISKCCNFSMNWDRVKTFQRQLLVTLRSIWGHFMPVTCPKFSWRWGGLRSPSNSPNRIGHIPILANPWCNI